MSKLEKLLQETELLIRKGEVHLAKTKLSSIDRAKVPRNYRVQLANQFMRSGSPDLSLRLLNRIVHSKGAQQTQASPEELTEYGSALISLGVTSEALFLLSQVDPNKVPSASLYIAFAHFTNWDYDLSLPYLYDFLNNPQITEYQKYVGNINLASALIVTQRHEEADRLLTSAIQEVQGRSEYTLLLGNMYELRVQMLVKSGEYEMADKAIEVATSYQKQNSGLSGIYLDKWRAVNNSLRHKTKTQGIQQLHSLAITAHEAQHWETVRECQFFLSRVLSDSYLFLKVYFGTPYPKYRMRILKEFPDPPDIPNEFKLQLQSSILEQPKTLDVKLGRLENEKFGLNPGSLTHKLLCLFTSDFFRPFRVPHIHIKLFPEEHFNPFSSPHRIHSLVNRLRAELKNNNIPIDIKSQKSGYRLIFLNTLAIKVYKDTPVVDKPVAMWQSVCTLYLKNGGFSRDQLSKDLNMSYRSVSRLINWAKDQGFLETEYHGRSAIYRFVNN